jgi:hypothetical protein
LTLFFKIVSIRRKQKSSGTRNKQTNKQSRLSTKGEYMREKKFIRTLTYLCVVITACGTAFAQQGKIKSGPYQGPMAPTAAMPAPDAPDAVIYTNLVVDSCTGCNYSAANGFFVLGPNNCFAPGATQWIAYPFVATRTQAVRQVRLAITDSGFCAASSNRFTVAIYSDNCTGTPGTQIGNAVVATAPAAPCALANANFGAAGVSCTVGTTYWVVVTTSTAASQMGTTAVWWEVNSAVQGFNLNDGNGWLSAGLGGPGGFMVQ